MKSGEKYKAEELLKNYKFLMSSVEVEINRTFPEYSIKSISIVEFNNRLINKIKKINESITITVFVEKNCEFSPYAVLFAVKAAAVNKRISVEIFNIEDVTFFKRELGIEGIPTTIIGDKYSFLGIQNDETLIQIIDEVINKCK